MKLELLLPTILCSAAVACAIGCATDPEPRVEDSSPLDTVSAEMCSEAEIDEAIEGLKHGRYPIRERWMRRLAQCCDGALLDRLLLEISTFTFETDLEQQERVKLAFQSCFETLTNCAWGELPYRVTQTECEYTLQTKTATATLVSCAPSKSDETKCTASGTEALSCKGDPKLVGSDGYVHCATTGKTSWTTVPAPGLCPQQTGVEWLREKSFDVDYDLSHCAIDGKDDVNKNGCADTFEGEIRNEAASALRDALAAKDPAYLCYQQKRFDVSGWTCATADAAKFICK